MVVHILISRVVHFLIDKSKLPKLTNNCRIYKINSTDYLDEGCLGFKFGAYNLPIVVDKDDKKERVVTFDELAERSIKNGIGDKKLGYLKLDVDNLGSIFISGLKENKSIIHVASLSRMLGLFFEGYINKLLEELKMKDKIYVVFSGGDDTFIIGAWDSTFQFCKNLYGKFRKYTCDNPSITFSASLGVYRCNYPVVRAATNSEQQLEKAKNYISKSEEWPQKNKVALFGQIFNWTEFNKIIDIKNLLVKLIAEKEESKSVLEKVMRSTKGFKKIMEDSIENKLDNIRFWRLAYYLRDIGDKNSAEQLISYYREIVIDNLLNKSKDEKIENIMIIPAAVRWAELETKNHKI
jgi:CRISPR-associated protein Csm1